MTKKRTELKLYRLVFMLDHIKECDVDETGYLIYPTTDNKLYDIYILAENKESVIFRAGSSIADRQSYFGIGNFWGDVEVLKVEEIPSEDYKEYIITDTPFEGGGLKVWCSGPGYEKSKWEKLSDVKEGTNMLRVSDLNAHAGCGAVPAKTIEAALERYRLERAEQERRHKEREERKLKRQAKKVK